MAKVHIVYSEEYGELEGAFNEEGKLIGMWSCNDACWRDEYFAPFMKALGVETITTRSPALEKKLIKEARRLWG